MNFINDDSKDKISKPNLFCDFQKTKESELRKLHSKVFPHLWNNEKCFGIMLTDITYQYDMISLENENKNKEMAISTVAHELRNPLGGLLGLIQMIQG